MSSAFRIFGIGRKDFDFIGGSSGIAYVGIDRIEKSPSPFSTSVQPWKGRVSGNSSHRAFQGPGAAFRIYRIPVKIKGPFLPVQPLQVFELPAFRKKHIAHIGGGFPGACHFSVIPAAEGDIILHGVIVGLPGQMKQPLCRHGACGKKSCQYSRNDDFFIHCLSPLFHVKQVRP